MGLTLSMSERIRQMEADSATRMCALNRRAIASDIEVMRSWLNRADASPAAHAHLDEINIRLERGEFDHLAIVQFQHEIYPQFGQFGLRLDDSRQRDREALGDCRRALDRI